MAKDCPAGRKWDSLVGICMLNDPQTTPEPGPSTELPVVTLVQLRSTDSTAQAHSVMLLMWIFVVLATLGSILALALWFIIYKRQTRHNSTSEEAGLQQEPLRKTEPPAKSYPPSSERNCQAERLQRAAWAPSPCPHLQPGALTGRKWEEGFTVCRDPAEHALSEDVRGLPTCSSSREHRIPLPATELGGTVLVTTKTV